MPSASLPQNDDVVQPHATPRSPPYGGDSAYERLDQSFENGREAYMSKTNFELLRCLTVFHMCSIETVVNKNKEVFTLPDFYTFKV